MKILKANVKVIQVIEGGEPALKTIYPDGYDATKAAFIAQESQSTKSGWDAAVARAVDIDGVMTSDDFLIVTVNDLDAPAFLASEDIIELPLSEARILGEQYLPPVTKVHDLKMVLGILEKYRLEEPVTADEKKAIDPEDDTKGINITPVFTPRLDKELAR